MLNKKSGFTLLEILLVIGIISVLVGIVIVAINPSKTLATVRNSERKSDLKQIDSALSQYYIDYNEYPASLTGVSDLTEICDTGTATSTAGLSCGGLIDLTALVPTYLTAIPTDPSATTTAHAGYKIIRTGKRISLSAPAELGQTITRGATTYAVTYNGNGNTGGTVPSNQTKTENITLALRTNSGTLVKTGHTFDGWATSTTGVVAYAEGANYTANAGVTLFAKWTVVIVDACSHVPTDPDCWSTQSLSDLAWGPFSSATGVSTSIALSNGKSNTDILIQRESLYGESYPAAHYCATLNDGTNPVGTWYLPSYAELWSAWNDGGSTVRDLFTNSVWSSTEDSSAPSFLAWFLVPQNNFMFNYFKGNTYPVRCLR